MPKFNMYQSLHTTVIGPGGKPVELQIRTWGMHRRSEYGVAAHWKYKEAVATGRRSSDLDWLRQLVDWQRETADPAEFLESLRFEVGSAEVYVFTPRGEVIALPQDATPVDFAYAIHTEVGHRTVGAKVNGRLVPLESPLSNGETGVTVEGAADVWARLSKCCTPVPGDNITGFVTRGNGVSVHRTDCINITHLIESEPERMVKVLWAPRESSRFLAAIQVEALDRTGLLSDITRSISEQHVNILSASVTTRRDQVALSKFTFEMGDPEHLRHVLRAVRTIDGVYDAHRVTSLSDGA